MAETRTAYRIDINYAGEQVVEKAQCVITPKRVAVTLLRADGRPEPYSVMHYEPQNWPSRDYAWTVEGAWEKFLTGKRAELQTQRNSVLWLEAQIAKAEAQIATAEARIGVPGS
jgi:hypothetical protein